MQKAFPCYDTTMYRKLIPRRLYTRTWGTAPKQWTHDDVIKWKHFPCYWGIYRSPLNSHKKTQWRGTLMFSLICARIGWVYNGGAGDLRRHRAHYDITVMRHHGRCFVTDLCAHTNCLRECLILHKCGTNSILSIQTWPLWISVKDLKHRVFRIIHNIS